MTRDDGREGFRRSEILTGAAQLDETGRGVLDGAFRLLRALPHADRDHQVRDLSRLTGIPRPSVYRLMAQMRAVAAVERPTGHYVVSQSLANVVREAEPIPGLRTNSTGVMQHLRIHTNGTVSLVVPTEEGCSAIEVIPGTETLSMPIYAGIAMPSSAAAALVLDPTPAPNCVDPVAGWASDNGRNHPHLTCYASAIRIAGKIEAVLQVSTTVDRPSHQFAAVVRQAAARIASQLGAA
jgi:DNA-binding IclR family transcriptional regulator